MSKIHITKHDLQRLSSLLEKKLRLDEYDLALKAELQSALVVEPEDIPEDVITMNSQVQLKDDNGQSEIFTLVFPEDSDFSENKVSILSPIGCSLIGYRIGSTVKFPTPKGDQHLTVEKILYQPERAGDFNL